MTGKLKPSETSAWPRCSVPERFLLHKHPTWADFRECRYFGNSREPARRMYCKRNLEHIEVVSASAYDALAERLKASEMLLEEASRALDDLKWSCGNERDVRLQMPSSPGSTRT